MCDGGLVRNLDVKAHGHNNDGIDLEMSRNFLVEDCSFDQGDDAVVIKAGRKSRLAWRIEYSPLRKLLLSVIVQNCLKDIHYLVLEVKFPEEYGIFICMIAQLRIHVMRLFFVKTNHRRGGFIENVYMKNVQAGTAQRVLEIDTEVLYQWKDFGTYL